MWYGTHFRRNKIYSTLGYLLIKRYYPRLGKLGKLQYKNYCHAIDNAIIRIPLFIYWLFSALYIILFSIRAAISIFSQTVPLCLYKNVYYRYGHPGLLGKFKMPFFIILTNIKSECTIFCQEFSKQKHNCSTRISTTIIILINSSISRICIPCLTIHHFLDLHFLYNMLHYIETMHFTLPRPHSCCNTLCGNWIALLYSFAFLLH